jgi:hypothetical protein
MVMNRNVHGTNNRQVTYVFIEKKLSETTSDFGYTRWNTIRQNNVIPDD